MTKDVRCAIVIPARLASTRLSEKLLRKVGGKSILQHTFEAASKATITDQVVVAVDHERLANEVAAFGGQAIMTSPNCASGTDRIAEVAQQLSEVDVFINVQGDEPEIEASSIDRVATALLEHRDAAMSTAGTPIRSLEILNDPSNVKIVMAGDTSAGQGRAVYFSRSVVPHCRGGVTEKVLAAQPPVYWHHLGLYAYRREFLQWFSSQPPSNLETLERLEQLRAIEAGRQIAVACVETAAPGIDTEQDLEAFRRRLEIGVNLSVHANSMGFANQDVRYDSTP